MILIFCYNFFKEGGIDYNSLSKTRPKCIHFFSSDNHYSFCIKRDRAVGHCKTYWHKRRGGKLLTLYIKKKTFALSIVMKISLSSMTMIRAHLPSSRNHYSEKRKWKMKIQYVKGLLAMSLSHDILSNFYLSSWVSWIDFIHYIFRPFLLNSLPYENVIYRNQSLLCSICSSGTPFIKRIKKTVQNSSSNY